MGQLKIIAQNITKHSFDYPFYCSRKLDIDEKQQKRSDQHSIRFEHFDGVTVLAFSGNYYGAYAADKFSEELRARQTFLSAVLPIAQASVPLLQNNPQVQGYAIEISHHVIGRTMGMPVERAENMMVYLPRNAAIKLVAATDKQSQQAALLESKIFLNANPLNIWLSDDGQPPPNEVARTQPVVLTLMPTVPSRSDVAEAKALPPSTHHRSRSHASRSKATSRDSTSRTNSISHTGDKRHTGAPTCPRRIAPRAGGSPVFDSRHQQPHGQRAGAGRAFHRLRTPGIHCLPPPGLPRTLRQYCAA